MRGMNGTDVDDRAAGLRKKGNGSLSQQERTPQIHVENEIPIVLSQSLQRAVQFDPGIVDEQVDFSPTFLNRGDSLLYVLSLPQISAKVSHGQRWIFRAQFLGSFLASVGITIQYEDVCAFALESGGNGLPNALRAAADECDAPA